MSDSATGTPAGWEPLTDATEQPGAAPAEVRAPRPLVAVLMATHNGEAFLEEQIASILEQRDIDIRLIVSDDGSTDGTRAIIERWTGDPRVRQLEPGVFGSPAANFLRLIRSADVAGCDAIAFSDHRSLMGLAPQ